MIKFLEILGGSIIKVIEQMGQLMLFVINTLIWIFRPPLRIRAIFKQMEFVGVKSLFVVILTGSFTGAVMTIQIFYGFSMFRAESLVSATLAIAMARELGPVLTALMVAGRAGSAIAAELGTMRVTEQIDALYVMAANPVKFLVVPRVLAGVVMLPILTVISNVMGIVGGFLVGVGLLDINRGIFINNIVEYLDVSDVFNGLIKSAVFGLILTLIGCYKGFYTTGGAEGVGKSTTEAVVMASILILASDYVMTAIMF
ncbi:MAG: ABC transporter permease [Deltaproteobacteria bacterium]|nr:ABC transporter permease [Deltaproteobacteria bacterium]MBW2085226.1 ABC transporter permease [Deltaproteobacteria bacterium]